jgi:hypothetical protein
MNNNHRNKSYEYNKYRINEFPIQEAESLFQDYEILIKINKLLDEIY